MSWKKMKKKWKKNEKKWSKKSVKKVENKMKKNKWANVLIKNLLNLLFIKKLDLKWV